jgi:type I restriction enzyme, S subunit
MKGDRALTTNSQVPEGYKQTEVGVIPEDWNAVLLDQVSIRGSGHTPDKKIQTYWNGDIKWISLKDSDQLDTPYIFDTCDKVTKAGIANSSAVLHPAGTVVLSRDAGVGKSSIMFEPMAVSQHFMAWQCGNTLNNLFLYYWLQSKKGEFERIAIGSTIKTIGLGYFKALNIPHPPIAEQNLIASALSDTDALIESLEQLLAKKRQIKQGAMQELLTGNRRLSGFGEGKGYKQTELGAVPEDWNFVDLNSVSIEAMQNGVFYTPSRKGRGVKIINVGDLYNQTPIDSETLELFDANSSEKERFKVESGDLFFTRSSVVPSGIAHCNIYSSRLHKDVVFDSHVIRVRPNKEKVNSSYLFRFCISRVARKYLIAHAKTGSMTTIDQGVLGKCPIFLPTIEEQTAIATILSDMDLEIGAIETKLTKARQLKQGMMHELLTGRIRLIGGAP